MTSASVPQRQPFTVSNRQSHQEASSLEAPHRALFPTPPEDVPSQLHSTSSAQVALGTSSRPPPPPVVVSSSPPSSLRDTSQLPPGFENFEHLFSPELGLVRNHTHTVKVRYNVPPVQSKLRRLPITLREAVSKEIFKLERQGVIERIDASEWVSPIVVVRKPDGRIRMCVDLRAPNQAVVIDSFPLPHIDELLNSLRGSTHFSKLDLASAYHQVRLDPTSRDLTSFITHEGLFRFKRVCFGLASAPAAFQKIMSKILEGCRGVQFYLDDIIVYGSSLEEHNANLRKVLSCIAQAGMKLNRKAVFQVQELSFLGHRLSMEGLAPLASKVDAVINFEPPSDSSKLKAFLGLVEYYSKFIPHCSTVVEPLRRLLRKGVPFVWSSEAEASFRKVQRCIQNAPILSMFDPTLPIVIATDASNYGLGAVLQQQHGNKLCPVAFASRTLTDAERRYSTGEKEALACLWACEKWHLYLWGRPFVIRTDHQALVTLLSNKGSGIRPLRITRWTSRLLNYNFKMEYLRGTNNLVADAFSRLPVRDTEDGTMFEDDVIALITTPLTQAEFQEATHNDPVLPAVIRYTTSSWPEDVTPELRPYFHVREQLSVQANILFQGEKIVVPERLRANIIQLAHETHQGISRTTSVIRDRYWWPRMNQEVKSKIEHCTVCHSTDKPVKAAPAPLQPVEFPQQPWEKLGIDIVGPVDRAPPSQRFFIVLVDYHSKWPEVQPAASVTSSVVITFLKNVFAREGLPAEIVSDNGVQFVSKEFQDFLCQSGIKHRRASLYHPQSNGQVERFNRVLKSCLQLAVVQGRPLPDAVRDYLEAYRRTPHAATGQAPCILLHGRMHRSKLDLQGMPTPQLPSTSDHRDVHDKVHHYQQKMKSYSDTRRAVRQPLFTVGQAVRVFQPKQHNKLRSRYSTPQIIQEQVGPATYRFSDGRTWNADKLTKTLLQPERQDMEIYPFCDDDDELLPNVLLPVPPRPISDTRSTVPTSITTLPGCSLTPVLTGVPPLHAVPEPSTPSFLSPSTRPVGDTVAEWGQPVVQDSSSSPGPVEAAMSDPGSPEEPGLSSPRQENTFVPSPRSTSVPGQSSPSTRPVDLRTSSPVEPGPHIPESYAVMHPSSPHVEPGSRSPVEPSTSTPNTSSNSAYSSMPELLDVSNNVSDVLTHSYEPAPAVEAPPTSEGRPVRQRKPPSHLKDYFIY